MPGPGTATLEATGTPIGTETLGPKLNIGAPEPTSAAGLAGKLETDALNTPVTTHEAIGDLASGKLDVPPPEAPPAAAGAAPEAVQNFNAAQITDAELLTRGEIDQAEFDRRQQARKEDAEIAETIRSGLVDKTDEQIQADALNQFPEKIMQDAVTLERRDDNKKARDEHIAKETAKRDAARNRVAEKADQERHRRVDAEIAAYRAAAANQTTDDELFARGDITREEYDRRKQAREDQKAAVEAEKTKQAEEAKARDSEIQRKWDAKEPLTVDELTRLQELRQQEAEFQKDKKNIEAEIDKLREKDPTTWNEAEKQRYAELTDKLDEIKQREKSPDEIREQQKKELEDMGTEFFQSFIDGDIAKAEQLAQVFNERLAAQQGLAVPEAGQQQLREFVRQLMKPESARNPKESARMQRLKEKLLQLSELELRIRSREQQAKEINKLVKKSQGAAAKAEDEYYNEQDPQEKQKKLAIFQGHALRVQSLLDAKTELQYSWIKDDIDRRNILGQIHRQIGSKGLIGNLLWGAGTAGRQAVFGGVQIVNYPRNLFA